MEDLLSSMGVTAFDVRALAALESVAQAETDRIAATASRVARHLSHKTVGVDAMRIACDTHMLLQPPVTEVRRRFVCVRCRCVCRTQPSSTRRQTHTR